MDILSRPAARRLALHHAALPAPAAWSRLAPRAAAHALIRHFGYLQLDTVSVAGARSHSIVLMSRLAGSDAALGESLLRPGAPLFEYWGHEASWLPLELYPTLGWRRRLYASAPWWGEVITAHRRLARELLRRLRAEGPLRALDLEGERPRGGGGGGAGWWDHKPAKQVALALWRSGALAIRERRAFQRVFDLPERVIPAAWRAAPEPSRVEALKALLLRALAGHGWATTGTLAQTFRLRGVPQDLRRAFAELAEAGVVVPCALGAEGTARPVRGWIRPADLGVAERLLRAPAPAGEPVLLSPFDPLLWDRARVAQLFDFALRVEIFTPSGQRTYGYFCLPVLAGERLVARVDLKAERAAGRLRVLSVHPEERAGERAARAAARRAVARFAEQAGLAVD